MTDFNPSIGVSIDNPTTGADLAAYLTELAAYVMSSGYLSALPVNAAPGLIWCRDSGGMPQPRFWDGSVNYDLFHEGNALGAVGQSGGLPTGALIETGSNANGRYSKFADGLMICEIRRLQLTYSAASSISATWTFPAAFASTTRLAVSANLRANADGDGSTTVMADANPTTTDVNSVMTGSLTASSVNLRLFRNTGGPDFLSGDFAHVSALAIGQWI